MALPPGYQPHTDPNYAATHMWNPQTGDVRGIEHVAPAPTAAPMMPPATAPMEASSVAPVGYGAVDVQAVGQDQGHVFAQYDKKIFIDCAKPSGIGETTHRLVRLLPPWREGLTIPYVKFAIHMLPASLHPAPGDRKWIGATCYDTDGGPGNCPICIARKAVLKVDADSGEIDRASARSKYAWQGLDLENLNQHFHQRINPATQQPEIGANGLPVYDIVPGIIKSGAQLWKAMRGLFPEKGDPTHIETGYPIKMKRTKTGPLDMNVEYGAVDMQPTPLDEQLRPVLANLFDLHKEFVHYLSAEEMAAIGAHIHRVGMEGAQAAATVAQQTQAQPPLQGMAGTAQPPNQGMTYPATNAAPPMPVSYAAPPAQPVAAPAVVPVVAAPAVVPAAIPPAGSPGGLPAPFSPAVPMPHAAVPPTSAPAPGLPGGLQGAPPVTPVMAPPVTPVTAPALLTGGQTPEEFEQSLPTKPGEVPF